MRKPFPIFGIVLVAGCTVGPDYKGLSPLPPAAQPGATFVRGSDAVSPDQPVLAQWWLELRDPVLNTLETRALAGNPGLDAAQARIEQARQNVRYERAQRLPTGALQGTYIYADLPGLDLGTDNRGSSGAPSQPAPGR